MTRTPLTLAMITREACAMVRRQIEGDLFCVTEPVNGLTYVLKVQSHVDFVVTPDDLLLTMGGFAEKFLTEPTAAFAKYLRDIGIKVTYPLPLPRGGIEGHTAVYDGLALRGCIAYLAMSDEQQIRLDVLYSTETLEVMYGETHADAQ